MLVAAHGNVDAYCDEHGMTVAERYTGKIEDYDGGCLILVTDNCEDKNEYYYLRYRLLRKKVELVSTHWDDPDIEGFVAYLNEIESRKRKKLYTGRAAFGFRKVDGEEVEDPATIEIARKIVAMRDAGWTYKKISENVCYPDGRKIAVSSVQAILRNRSKYE